MNVGFYIIGRKGLLALQAFVVEFGNAAVSFVEAARDSAIQYDAFDDISQYCADIGLPFFERGADISIAADKCDACFAIGWRWLIDDGEKLVVFHDSPLPKYRGFAPLVNMLIDGREYIAVTALLAASEYDRGDIVAQASLAVEYPIKIADAIELAGRLYAKLTVDVGYLIQRDGVVKGTPQDDAEASYSLWRDEQDYRIDFTCSAADIARFIDAVGYPYKGASAIVSGNEVRVCAGEEFADVAIENRNAHIGKVIFMNEKFPVVVCGSGLLKITDLRGADGESLLGSFRFRSRFESC
ncbi:methionyl-tRNA formyltransferase [Spongiibacter tropicus]|uniref:methionyl-tRNA formyltransferase n=1 Tax=Spongiibacter tropicus TaxID=454602 RepID=UPI0003B452EB|nr:formyltransferase family protein [Spongiibacter tropicus]